MTTAINHADPAVDDVPLESLTDEELAFLGGPGVHVVTPYFDERGMSAGTPDLEPLVRTAYRGLLARGIVDPPATDDRPTGPLGDDPAALDLQIRSDVATTVTLRTASSFVVVARTTERAQDFWYAHLNHDVVLIEEVSGDGIHRFALSHTARLAERLIAATIHPDAADGEGDSFVLPVEAAADPTPPVELLERLGAAFVRADLVVRAVGDTSPEVLGLYSGPAGCWLVSSGRPGAGRDIVARPLPAEELRTIVAQQIAPVVEQHLALACQVPA
ncbi:hypothetical protein [Aeromicrobium sp.]|uniref:hypothetical protein n=1 Tax=Aeromicrobium sp. TaxID=1871063 RepID=UPI0019C170BB|nr:hypothetical protein [Aeromicrobium sp.]MBC7630094.1 hypothetical protein [Aeromicrobium sp.]